jgi:hypothetical protein
MGNIYILIYYQIQGEINPPNASLEAVGDAGRKTGQVVSWGGLESESRAEPRPLSS